LLADALARSSRVLGDKHPQTVGLVTGLSVAYANLGQLEKAEALARRCVDLRRSVLGDQHPLTIASTLILARIYVLEHRLAQAHALTGPAIQLARNLALESNPFLIWHLGSLGWHYLEQGDLDRAGTLCDLALEGVRRKPDSNPIAIPRVLAQAGAVRLAQRRYPEAEELLREASRRTEKLWPGSAQLFYVRDLLGESLADQARYAEAEPLLLEGCQGLRRCHRSMLPYLDPARRVSESLQRLVRFYEAWGKSSQAAEWKQQLANFQGIAARTGERQP